MSEEKTQPSSAPNFNELEKEVLKFWDEDNTFQKSLEQTKDGEPYIFYDGPPFATGLPHYGSILPSVIKDAIPRYQTMKGRFVRRRWGWDCHGLPIENMVEQQLKISGKKQIEELGVDKFNEACRQSVLRYADEWGKTIKRIARWVDFDNSYKTMDTSYQESVWWALKQIWEKDLIYEDRKVLLYCSRCETPISNFEVAMDNSYKDVTEESVYAKFKMPKGQRIVNDLTNDKTYVLAWTTTPWTLPGNTSLNVGPNILYVIIEQENGERYILAKERLSIINGSFELIAEFPAHALEGLMYEPLYPGVIPSTRDENSTQRDFTGDPAKSHRIYIADFVTTTDGTGVVHNAAMYGEDDYQLAKEKDLPRVDMLDHKGKYLDYLPETLRGVFFKDAEKIVLEELAGKNLVYKTESYTHSYPHCYRCGTPLFYNALPAWFINIQKIKPYLVKNNQDINWYPEHLKFGRFKQGIENAPDWNISRNRFWATALPFWKCENKECKNVVCVGSVEELMEKSTNFKEVYPNFSPTTPSRQGGTPLLKEGGEAPHLSQDNGGASPPAKEEYPAIAGGGGFESLDLHRPYIDQVILKCEKCNGQMNRIPEVVDCWVESGSMPFAELHAPFENQELFGRRFPSDFVVEYIPQTRAWFYVMHVVSTILFEHAPFKNVVTTGTILAEDGSKMSKSKNNYPDPNLVIEKYGADALRFYLLTSPVVIGEDLNFSEKGVQEISRKVNMLIYNVWSFLRLYTKDSFSGEFLPSENILDKWIVSRLSQVHKQVTGYLDAYDTVRAGKVITAFIDELSTWYLRRSRDRIKNNDDAAKTALATLAFVLTETSKMLAPFMPFLAEFIYRNLTAKESIHLTLWTLEIPGDNETVRQKMSFVKELVEAGLSLRKEKNIKVRQPLAEVEYHIKSKELVLDADFEKLLADELNVKLVSNRQDFVAKGGWAYKETPGFKLELNLELSDELKQEGAARELERQIQDLRKKSELKVGELVDVFYNTGDEKLEDALLTLVDRKKTFISQISKSLEVEVDFEIQSQIEGKAVWLGMVKI
jgi:isoleucyl-tRNA synthetase